MIKVSKIQAVDERTAIMIESDLKKIGVKCMRRKSAVIVSRKDVTQRAVSAIRVDHKAHTLMGSDSGSGNDQIKYNEVA